MSRYLLPCSDIDGPWIEAVTADGYNHAVEKFCTRFYENVEIDLCTNLKDLEGELQRQGILIGEVREIEEYL